MYLKYYEKIVYQLSVILFNRRWMYSHWFYLLQRSFFSWIYNSRDLHTFRDSSKNHGSADRRNKSQIIQNMDYGYQEHIGVEYSVILSNTLKKIVLEHIELLGMNFGIMILTKQYL